MAAVRAALPLVLALHLAACGSRTGLADPADASPDDIIDGASVDVAMLDVSASFYVYTAPEGARVTSAGGVFWTGDRQPAPGGGGGRSYRLAAGESVSVNGVALMGGFADWGYTYQAGTIPVRPDGRWDFRFVVGGVTVTRTLVLQPIRWVDFPAGAVSIGRPVTLRWAPPLPAETTRRAYLTSCVLNDRTEVGTSSATFWGRLSAMPCRSHAIVSATLVVPVGAPFRSGNLSAATGLDRELDVVP